MRHLLIVSLLIGGCATRIRPTPEQECAGFDMVVDGVDITSRSGRFARCSKPASETQTCHIQAHKKSLGPVEEYNDDVTRKNWFLVGGYVIYVVPGIVLYNVYGNEKDDAIEKSAHMAEKGVSKCETKTAH
jgi:hypothetical protein